MTTNSTCPAATEAARDVIFNTLSGSDASAFMFVTGETDRILTALHDAGLTITAALPSGQVTISEQTRQIAWAVLIERANDYIDAQELTPHYGTTATIGTPWDSAIAELAALKGAAR